jgi:hypothetical protein
LDTGHFGGAEVSDKLEQAITALPVEKQQVMARYVLGGWRFWFDEGGIYTKRNWGAIYKGFNSVWRADVTLVHLLNQLEKSFLPDGTRVPDGAQGRSRAGRTPANLTLWRSRYE